MNSKHTPSPASVFQQQTPFDERIYLQQARLFLERSPSSSLKMALAIINFCPASWQAWALLFKSAKAVQKGKTYWPTEWLIGKLKKIRNLKNGAAVLQRHPTNVFLWEQICDIAINGHERDLEEIVRRIILDCDLHNPKYLSGLAEFLCQKGKVLARGEKQTECFLEAETLIGAAVEIDPNNAGLHRMQINILATVTSLVQGWEEVDRSRGTYRDLLSTLDQPSVGQTQHPRKA